MIFEQVRVLMAQNIIYQQHENQICQLLLEEVLEMQSMTNYAYPFSEM